MKKSAITLLLLMLSGVTLLLNAQDTCEAEHIFSTYENSNTGNKGQCITISLNSDPNGMQYNYEWELSDGHMSNDEVLDHCFEQYGTYLINLHLVDPVSGHRFRNELSEIIHLEVPDSITIVTYEKPITGRPLILTYKGPLSAGTSVTGVYWNIDGKFYCNDIIEIVPEKPGKMNIHLMVTIERHGATSTLQTTGTIPVIHHNIDGYALNNLFAERKKTAPLQGRFLEDAVNYVIYNCDNKADYQFLHIDNKKQRVEIDANTNYCMFAWSGNMFTRQINFSTSSDPEIAEKDFLHSFTHLLNTEIMLLNPYIFDENEKEVAVEKLVGHTELLKTYKYLNVAIGVYTHTEGKLDINIPIVKQRGQNLKKYFTDQGIMESRITILTANEDPRLMNTCHGVSGCDWEDERMNKRAEFKINLLTTTL
ncbi:MAG: PKD domain-containing protein [Cyclobacteriaceae bacterium]|nr:PKD domain-containing protein [Cyclobacteriaceae bacterium]